MMNSRKVTYRAGFIPYYIDETGSIKMMFMVPSSPLYGGDRPQIAKGKIDDGEIPATAALREASEELGLRHSNVAYFDMLGVYFGRTTLYYGQIRDPLDFDEPSYETKHVVWLSEDQFVEEGRELHVSAVQDMCKIIKNTINTEA